ncbi:hypothetical protein [Solidesulfovibrio magneticus]|uniref:Class I SAM-dependent methyltransferase n=1 Tax=Solidesulfovibrio magneticus (strain ATCC 700980 / DSM 13731 / RS-1) TaxID=573370 RepID=C4XIQ9_SOLM1|nr:hypothetical protein [Solidesulfovibrio magneticus]BAH76627.1 hypothetical protein DMR_31360 [Solidesulfovibrio magneticus RS-1]
MLRELFALWRDRGARLARSLGQDREAVSIAARHRRCRAAWEPHLAATRRLVLDAAVLAPERDTAVVLGSGACLDVPVAELAEQFAQVVLVDAHHPWQARALAKGLPNVRLVAADVTGLAGVARDVAKGRAALPSPVPLPDPLPGIAPDFTASVNLASQLAIPFYSRLGRRLPDEARQAFYTGIVMAHGDWLAGLPGRVCLCCDTAWERVDGDKVLESCDALEGVALPPPDRTWTWAIAPRPEESPAYDRQNRVAGYLDFAAAWRGRKASEMPAAMA